MSVFLYKKAIKIESKEKEEEHADDDDEKRRNEHTNIQSDRESIYWLFLEAVSFVTAAAAAAAHLFIKFDELL